MPAGALPVSHFARKVSAPELISPNSRGPHASPPHHPTTSPPHHLNALLLSVVSGLLFAACFPRFDLGWLAWVALAPLFLAVRMSRPRAAALCGYAMGIAFFGIHIGWLGIFGWYVGLAATLFEAGWTALFGVLAATLLRRSPPRWAPLVLSAAWTAVDWVRTLGPFGFSWGSIAVSQHRTLPVLQVVDLIGPWGLTWLIALVNAALAEPAYAAWVVGRESGAAGHASRPTTAGESSAPEDAPRATLRLWMWPAVSVALPLLAALRGALILAAAPPLSEAARGLVGAPAAARRAPIVFQPEEAPKTRGAAPPNTRTTLRAVPPQHPNTSTPQHPNTRAIRLAVVQGNVDQDVLWDWDYIRATMERYARLTRAAAAQGAEVIVWPETVVPGELRYDAELLRQVCALARETRAWLVIGSNDHDPRDGRELNQAFLVNPDGELTGSYAKVRLVPFGEFVPLRPLFPFLEAFHVRPFNLCPGPGFTPLQAGAHTLGALICFESSFPEVSRALVRGGAKPLSVASSAFGRPQPQGPGGAEVLIELTNDTWFGHTPAAAQHAAMAVLRAVETRRSFARAVTTGISQLIDPYGRVVASVGLFRTGYLLASMPIGTGATPYVRWGDWPAYAAALVVVALLLRRRKPAAALDGAARVTVASAP